MQAPATMRSKAPRQSHKTFVYVALATVALQLVSDLELLDLADSDSAFAVPATPEFGRAVDVTSAMYSEKSLPVNAAWPGRSTGGRATATAARAAAASAGVGAKVLNAMGAGAVASVIQAALSAVGEPIVNRVLVKRMKVMDAINDVSPMLMLRFFQTTLITNFLKFPFFEAINAFCACFPVTGVVRGIFTGFVFTSATLPVTNYRYRKSMELEVKWGNIYEAYLPTVIRDIVYGIARNYCTIGVLNANPQWTAASPQTLFIVVILGCLISAPFNEWRGFLLQSKGQEIPFNDFFKPMNFIRSTGLGAFKQGLALALGYWCAPPVTKFVRELLHR